MNENPIKEPDSILETVIEQRVATVTLNRPHKFNALSEEMLAELQTSLTAIGKDDEIAVVILRARGRAFCAGHDLRQMRANHGEQYYQALFNSCSTMMQTIRNLPQPVIASVQGLATAAGCQLVATCDLAIAANTAQFAVSGINLGLFCSTPSVALSRNINSKRALEMLLTGDFISAETAVEYGLINQTVNPDQLGDATQHLADKIASKPKSARTIGKSMFYSQQSKSLDDAYSYAAGVMASNMMAEETLEAVDKFLNKKSANLPNR